MYTNVELGIVEHMAGDIHFLLWVCFRFLSIANGF